MSRTTSIAMALVVIGALSLPFLSVAKWIGHFTLAVELDVAPNVDVSSIAYAECRNENEAQWFCGDGAGYDAGYEPPYSVEVNIHNVSVTCFGDSGGYGLYDTYHQPEFLVVRYRTIDDSTTSFAHESLAIPLGRGPRQVKLTLP